MKRGRVLALCVVSACLVTLGGCVLRLVFVTTIPIVRFVASIKSVLAVCVSPMTALVRGVKPITFALETCVMVQHRLVRGVDRIKYVAI